MADERQVPYIDAAESSEPTKPWPSSSPPPNTEEPTTMNDTALSSSVASPPLFANRTTTLDDNKGPTVTGRPCPPTDHGPPPEMRTESYENLRSFAMKLVLWVADELGLRNHGVAMTGTPPVGEARRKHHLHAIDIFALVVVLICFMIWSSPSPLIIYPSSLNILVHSPITTINLSGSFPPLRIEQRLYTCHES